MENLGFFFFLLLSCAIQEDMSTDRLTQICLKKATTHLLAVNNSLTLNP